MGTEQDPPRMPTVEERKRLDELELLDDVGGLSEAQRDERGDLAAVICAYSHEALGLFRKAERIGVDVAAVLRAAIAAHGEPTDFRCNARKALEEIK